MRDPSTNTKEIAAFADTRRLLGLLYRVGALRSGIEELPDLELRFLARAELMQDEQRPEPERCLSHDVRNFFHQLLDEEPAAPPRKGRRSNEVRDRVLAGVVRVIAHAHDLNPTRKRESRRETRSLSACAVVAKVLAEIDRRRRGKPLSERGVEEVWERLGDQIQPEWQLAEAVFGGHLHSRAAIDRLQQKLENLVRSRRVSDK